MLTLSSATENAASDRLVSCDVAAEVLDVSLATIRRFVAAGSLASVRVGRCRRIPASALERAIREGLPARRIDTTPATAVR
jgi:excisionase family DNA binding protein